MKNKLVTIYKIVNLETNEIIYVGSTTRTIEQRYKEHCTDFSNLEKVEYLKNNPCVIRKLEDVNPMMGNPLSIEQYYIEEYQPLFNRHNALYDKYKVIKRATERAKEIINNLNKKIG